MTLIIDLSINMKKINSLTAIENYISYISKKYNSILSYSNHEINGEGRQIKNHYYIHTLYFDDINKDNYNKLIKDIKKESITIDKIYNDKI